MLIFVVNLAKRTRISWLFSLIDPFSPVYYNACPGSVTIASEIEAEAKSLGRERKRKQPGWHHLGESSMLRVLPAAVLILVLSPFSSLAGLSFNVTYQDVEGATNFGFDDPTSGAQRRATLESALNYVSRQLRDDVYNTTLDFLVNTSQSDGTGGLASAGTFWFTSPNRFDNGFAYQHATTGMDPLAGFPDAQATFDFGFNWNSGLGTPGAGQVDLFSVALHEITHALGFLSLASNVGNSLISAGNPGVFSVYDSFLERGDGSQLFGGNGLYLGDGADLVSGDVFFDGPNARLANGGNPIPIYAPGDFELGSSISHIDPSLDAVMNPAIDLGVVKRDWTAFDRAILSDVGWQFVPEPSSSLALIVFAASAVFRRHQLDAKDCRA